MSREEKKSLFPVLSCQELSFNCSCFLQWSTVCEDRKETLFSNWTCENPAKDCVWAGLASCVFSWKINFHLLLMNGVISLSVGSLIGEETHCPYIYERSDLNICPEGERGVLLSSHPSVQPVAHSGGWPSPRDGNCWPLCPACPQAQLGWPSLVPQDFSFLGQVASLIILYF